MCQDHLSHWGPFFKIAIWFFWKSWLIHLYVTWHFGTLKTCLKVWMTVCVPVEFLVANLTSQRCRPTAIPMQGPGYSFKFPEKMHQNSGWRLWAGAAKSLVQFLFCYYQSDVLHLCNKSCSQLKWLLKTGQMFLNTESRVCFWFDPLKLWLLTQSRSSKIPLPHLIIRNSIRGKPLRSSM